MQQPAAGQHRACPATAAGAVMRSRRTQQHTHAAVYGICSTASSCTAGTRYTQVCSSAHDVRTCAAAARGTRVQQRTTCAGHTIGTAVYGTCGSNRHTHSSARHAQQHTTGARAHDICESPRCRECDMARGIRARPGQQGTASVTTRRAARTRPGSSLGHREVQHMQQ